MSVRDLIVRNRSYRRFVEDEPVSLDTLRELVDLARLTPSAANRQPLRYILSADPNTNAQIFPALSWAGYLKDWPGPAEGERPAAYIVILNDTTVSKTVGCDHGIAAQTILLGAVEKGLGGCMLGSVKRDELRGILQIELRHEILLVLALGKPAETVTIDPLNAEGDIRYWRDEQDVHHVPKRALDDLILG